MTSTEPTKVLDQDFPATDGSTINLKKLKGKFVVLYFYPKDSTPGCTIESKAFRDLHNEFAAKNAEIIGVSRDTIKSHEKFKTRCELPFPLIADEKSELCHYFGVIGEKTLFGKKLFDGLIRSTFLINPEGKIIQSWRKVSIKNHAQEVLDSIPTVN
ncbi:MAG: peroxiredoxin [Gammaproteobacteria bacterium]|nr:peroxiredoxin [Gammaproteobacteria bacterium]